MHMYDIKMTEDLLQKEIKSQKKPSYLKKVSWFHIDSFNFVVREGLRKALLDFDPVYTKTEPHVKISISDAEFIQLQWPMNTRTYKKTVYPAEARERSTTYYAELKIGLEFETESEVEYFERIFFVPVMLKSDLCYLNGMDDFELQRKKEDPDDPGGYFIVEGKERIVRTFAVPRRNYPLALVQNKWKTIGAGYSEYGILISSVRENHARSDVSLHYVNITKDTEHVSVEVRVFYQGKPYHIPFMLLLKSLVDECDYSIIKEILKFRKQDISFKICLMNMLRDLHVITCKAISSHGVFSSMQAKNFIGNLFYPVFVGAPDASYCDITDHMLNFSVSKLFSLVKKECKSDDLDNPVFQEVLSPGQTYLFAVKEGARVFLNSVKNSLDRKIKGKDVGSFREIVKQSTNRAICLSPIVKNVISTGNMPGRSHGLMSSTGYTIPLQRTNVFEVASQFSGIYKFSMQFYSKNMRKFYPESWGFLCPAHTPEGENTGLYNNLASGCQVVSLNSGAVKNSELYKLGVLPFYDPLTETNFKKTPIFVDGKILGWIGQNHVETLRLALKFMRSKKTPIVPEHTEIVYIPEEIPSVLFPGFYIFSTPCRLIRCVKNVCGNYELIGCFEQLMTQVSLDGENKDFEFAEVNNSNFLGMTASTIPFGENNASMRNIFSTGKVKQAIGFPFPNSFYRSDTKSMFLTYPQTPLVSTSVYDNYNWDENPIGTNLCIAIISYSGFDMEDAVVLNKASLERGLMHDVMYKNITYSFEDLARDLDCNVSELEFKCDPEDPYILYLLDAQGMPYVGRTVTGGLPVLSVFSRKSNRYLIKKYEGRVPAYIDAVKFMGTAASARNNNLPVEYKKVKITYRIKRIPEVGDKFNNRHGQKGVCGAVLPPEDLPFTADGVIPDILFNPHGLPSRMSVGMLLEILASKAAVQKCSRIIVKPFQYTEKENAAEHFGNILKDAGLDYYGTETFYSGTSGEKLEADIFCGSVYHFKLCHFVEDKYQVVSVATEVDPKTMQPLNRNKVGAIRFGEMEKDAIISHGAMHLNLDRLLLNSDQCKAYICSQCETLLFPVTRPPDPSLRYSAIPLNDYCDVCKRRSTFLVRIPYVLVYLVSELAVMGIKMKFSEK